ncbi:MAG: DNA internalization-related competence protein ComEC/Rec2 [Bacillota bacterium]|jgi:competence protein ComEC
MSQNHLWALGAVIAGICVAVWVRLDPAGWLLAGLLLFGVIVWRQFGVRQLPEWLLLGVLFCGGACLFGYQRQQYLGQLQYNRAFTGKNLILAGRIVSRPEVTEHGVRFELRLRRYRDVPRGKITVYYGRRLPETWLGREVRVVGRFKSRRLAGTPWPDFYERRRLTGVLVIAKRPNAFLSRPTGFNPAGWANELRLKLSRAARHSLSPLNRQVLEGMIFGAELSEEGEAGAVLEDFRRTGTIHLLTVSGLHVGFVVAGLSCLLGWLRLSDKGRIPLVLAGVWFYILMTGMKPPVLRSGLMLALYLMAKRLGAKDDPLNRLSLAALVLLAVNPYNLFEVGFQLSFAATAGVVGLYPVLKECFPAPLPFLKPLWRTVLVSVAAQAMVLPLLACYFYQISWVAPLANLCLALPALLGVVGGLAGELIGLGWPWLGGQLLGGVNWVLTITLKVIHLLAQPAWAATGTPGWPLPLFGAYYLGLLLVVNELRPNLLTGKRTANYGALALAGLAGLTLVVWTGFYLKTQAGYLEMTCIDVGQGDSLFLKTPDGFTVLIDGGAEGQGRNRVLPYLRQKNITRLNLAVGTHGHNDHLGGLDEVLQRIPADTLYLPRRGNPEIRKLLRKLKPLQLTRRIGVNGGRLNWGKYVKTRLFTFPDATNENDRSIVILVGYGKNRMLLTGDLECKGEKFLTAKYPQLLAAAVLKVGHHGSAAASGWSLLSQVKPRIGVISVGTDNRHGHPDQAALNRLHSLGTTVYRTDRQGTIRLRIYPDRILALPDR